MPDLSVVVVLAKASFRASEEQALRDFGTACALREKLMLTAPGAGGAIIPILEAYTAAGGTPKQLTAGDLEPFDGRYTVVVFTDKRMQDTLDERMPDWRTRNWIVIHNPKETEQAGRDMRKILSSLGTPLSDLG